MHTSPAATLTVLDALGLSEVHPLRPRPSLAPGLTDSPLLRSPIPLARVGGVDLPALPALPAAFVGVDVREPSERHLVCELPGSGGVLLALPLRSLDPDTVAQMDPSQLRTLHATSDSCHLVARVLDAAGELTGHRHLLRSARTLDPELLPV